MVDVEVDLAVLQSGLVLGAGLVGDGAAPALQVSLGHAEVLQQQVSALGVHGADSGAADAQGQLLLEDLLNGGDIVLLQEVVGDAVNVADGVQAAHDGHVAGGGSLAQGALFTGPLGRSAVDESQVHRAVSEQVRSAHAAGAGGLNVDQAEAAVVLQVLAHFHDGVVGGRANSIRGEHQGLAGEVGSSGFSALSRLVGAGRGLGLAVAAAGNQRQRHDQCKDHRKYFFHVCSPFK